MYFVIVVMNTQTGWNVNKVAWGNLITYTISVHVGPPQIIIPTEQALGIPLSLQTCLDTGLMGSPSPYAKIASILGSWQSKWPSITLYALKVDGPCFLNCTPVLNL